VERSIEFKVPLYCALIDYKGALDALNRTTLARVLGLFLSPSMIRLVVCLYFDAKAQVVVDGVTEFQNSSLEFNLMRSVGQGCPASPSVFAVALPYISWSFRLAFEVIKLVHLHISTLEYADDQILFTLSVKSLQDILNFIVVNATLFGLRLSPKNSNSSASTVLEL